MAGFHHLADLAHVLIRYAVPVGGYRQVWFMAASRDLKVPAIVYTSQSSKGKPTAPGDDRDGRDLETLYRNHAPAMYRVAVTVVRNPTLAEDVVQESLVKAWLGLEHFRGDAQLRTWLLRITHNTAVSELRRIRDTPHDPRDLRDFEAPGPDAEVINRALMAAFEKALFELDALSRAIVTLREIEELSYDEITEVLGVPLSMVKTRLFRARHELKDRLTGWRSES